MRRLHIMFLLIGLVSMPSLVQAGTKEEILRLQSDVQAMQNQIRELEKNFNEKTDGLKSLVVQLNDQVAKSNIILERVAKSLDNQDSGTRSAEQVLLQEVRSLSGKVDDAGTRISALAQQLSELKMQTSQINQSPASGTSPSSESIYTQAKSDLNLGNFDLAIQGFNAYLSDFPGGTNAAAAQYGIGEAYYNQNKLPEAIKAFTQVINNYPDSSSVPTSLFKRANAELAMQERENAIADFKYIIERFPTAAEADLAKDKIRDLGVNTEKPKPTTRSKTR
jgi:tol-pal system protein YbgF